jgi:KDO2-lipid IV(A) lauroyltransferase
VVPIYIERLKDENFNLTIYEPIKYNKNESVEEITLHLNQILEKMILKNPDQWIWTHNRWKK